MLKKILTDPIFLTLVLSASDAFWYGFCHEIKRWFGKSIFKEYQMQGETWVPFYRLFIQWPLDIAAVSAVYLTGGFWATLWMLGAWYFMNKEMNYYLALGQWKELRRYEKEGINVYWLDRLYFSGSMFFIGGFTVKGFVTSYIISWVCLAVSEILKIIK
jgi:hypothetical protein